MSFNPLQILSYALSLCSILPKKSQNESVTDKEKLTLCKQSLSYKPTTSPHLHLLFPLLQQPDTFAYTDFSSYPGLGATVKCSSYHASFEPLQQHGCTDLACSKQQATNLSPVCSTLKHFRFSHV